MPKPLGNLQKKVKVAFHSHGLTLRGSEVALFDYAVLCQKILGHRSIIVVRDRENLADNPIFQSWQKELPCLVYENKEDLTVQLRDEKADVLYQIKPGRDDNFVISGVRNCIHAMFVESEFHGDVYAYVSPWLSRVMTGREDRFVPHLVSRHESKTNLRKTLGIPENARVFGRHGASDTFNISFSRETVKKHAKKYPGDHFVFLNTEKIRGTDHFPNIHYLPPTACSQEKAAFLATCDAMLHARWHGETFGLAVGEFAVLGKPVITFSGSRERAHLEMSNGRMLLYSNAKELENILQSFQPAHTIGTQYDEYADPSRVMKKFSEIFLSP
jgi:hypothetical protein